MFGLAWLGCVVLLKSTEYSVSEDANMPSIWNGIVWKEGRIVSTEYGKVLIHTVQNREQT